MSCRNVTHHDGDYRAEKAQLRTAAAAAVGGGPVPHRHGAGGAWCAVNSVPADRRRLAGTGGLRISHETIYRQIRWDNRRRRSVGATRILSKFGRNATAACSGVLPGKRPIGERPVEVELRRRIGHWEGDTVMGSDMHHCVLTLVERKTGYAIIKKLKARTMHAVTHAASRAIRSHCRKFKTITFDNGTEFHDYARLEQRFPVKIYFATPYHSWERGSNENFNGLLRQYLPKGTCMSTVTQGRCNQIADDLNRRPRKRHGFKSPTALYHRN